MRIYNTELIYNYNLYILVSSFYQKKIMLVSSHVCNIQHSLYCFIYVLNSPKVQVILLKRENIRILSEKKLLSRLNYLQHFVY